MINTKKTDFRVLRFGTGSDVIREAQRIAAADHAGALRRSGNWTAGQVFGHLATWIEFALDGYPPNVQPPAPLKFILKFMKGKFVRGPMPRGVRIPGFNDGTLGVEPMPTDAALDRLRRAWERLMSTAPTVPNPIFGLLFHDDWIKMNLRHAELHMGYLHPPEK
ncbi:MAG: DUF1569 domain-containing protein [Phycisphaerales bacterium]